MDLAKALCLPLESPEGILRFQQALGEGLYPVGTPGLLQRRTLALHRRCPLPEPAQQLGRRIPFRHQPHPVVAFLQVRVGAIQGLARLALFVRQSLELCSQECDARIQGLWVLCIGLGEQLLDLGEQGADLLPERLRLHPKGFGDARIAEGLEQHLQNALALQAACQQEFLELALGQQHHLPELAGLESHELHHLGIHCRGLLGGDGDGAIPLEFPEVGCVRLFLETSALHLRYLLLRYPLYAVSLPAQLELEAHVCPGGGIGEMAAHVLGFAQASAGLSVERVADGIEDAGLARSRGTMDEEEVLAGEIPEVQFLKPRIGSEGLDGEAERFHSNLPSFNPVRARISR